jgi:multicomponent Na+:H+ antiporter subunit G
METLITLLPLVGKIMMGLGAFFLLTSAVGVLRFPEFFMRLHPAGIADSLGAPLMLLGMALQFPLGLVTLKILVMIVFALIAAATACHALAKAARESGLKPELGKKEK